MSLGLTLQRHLLWAGILLAAGSCGNSSLSSTTTTEQCTAGQKRCSGNDLQMCGAENTFQTMQTCSAPTTCDDNLGCIACQPGTSVCGSNGVEIHSCLADGSIGPTTSTCSFGQACRNGACVDACEVAASEFVYVVDTNNNFLSFEPRIDTDPKALKLIGKLNCSTSGAKPFSMAVDRKARAWVLYDDGTIYLVNPQDASCMPSTYQSGQQGFKAFGMGFVSDTAGSSSETLYVGNNQSNRGSLGLATINPATLVLTKFANFPANVTSSPEMTGTGASQLFGYFPSNTAGQHMIVQINRQTGAFDTTYQLSPLPSAPMDWAFAHWGGRYYQFVTTSDGVSRILRYNPQTKANDVVQTGTMYPIVGAGVSTCAPTTVG